MMAATNRVDILDPAILRPGRFDRKVAVGRPDVKGREEILRVHAKDKPLGEDVDLAQIARTTAGFTGADLENLLNEAAIEAARKGRGFILQSDIKGAFIKVGIGAEKKSKVISEKEKRSPRIMNPDMRSCFMYFRIWILSTRFPLSRQEWEQQVTPCLFRIMMRCLIPKEKCFRIL